MKKFLVIGESCLDVFHYGFCTRLTPEAPAPVFNSMGFTNNGGMAMNVFRNLKIFCDDVDIHTNENWEDIRKTRFVEKKSNHMFLRLDERDDQYGRIDLNKIEFSNYDCVIVSDYNKGYLSVDDLMQISKSHNKTFLDTKKDLGVWSKNYSFVKINGVEYDRTKQFLDKEMMENLIVTQGPKGCFYRNKRYPVPLVEVKDVSGAGDTFLSAFAFQYTITENVANSIEFANECSTKVVQKRGVTTI
ncbi:PfkB family carbohydrate kinase [bacterium]|nr:PfkB family carbohydrate kinase [bacterium]